MRGLRALIALAAGTVVLISMPPMISVTGRFTRARAGDAMGHLTLENMERARHGAATLVNSLSMRARHLHGTASARS